MNGFRSKNNERKNDNGRRDRLRADVFAQTGRFSETLPTSEARF
jgi:hypothetical protein